LGFQPQQSLHEQLGIPVTKKNSHSTWKSKTIKLLNEIINYPDPKKRWYKYAVTSAVQYLSKHHIDVIISTSPPVITHLIARTVSQQYQIPWIADLRDPWARLYDDKQSLITPFQQRLSSRTLKFADSIVAVTSPQVDMLKSLFPHKNVACITNSFDPDDFPETPSNLTEKFTITHTGTLYNGKRDPSLLFQVVSKLIQSKQIKKDLIKLRFYGKTENWLVEEIKKYDLVGVVSCHGRIPREEILEKLRESQLLLLLRLNTVTSEQGDCPAKIFEYFGARRPILGVGGFGGIIRDLLHETRTGTYGENAEELEQVLRAYYQEFLNFGRVACGGNGNLKKYTSISMARSYSRILDEIAVN